MDSDDWVLLAVYLGFPLLMVALAAGLLWLFERLDRGDGV